MSYSEDKLEQAKAAAAAAGPCVVEEIQSYGKWKAPEYFSCPSGVLLWGQLPTLMQGYLEKELDTPLGPYDANRNDVDSCSTILMNCFRYRAPARKGLWKVEAVFTGVPEHPIGYLCHHIDVDGPDIIRRAAVVGGSNGVSLQNDHEDRDIVYVNRYDWSEHGAPASGFKLMTELLQQEKQPKEKKTLAKPLLVIPSSQTSKGRVADPEENGSSEYESCDSEYEDEEEEFEEEDDVVEDEEEDEGGAEEEKEVELEEEDDDDEGDDDEEEEEEEESEEEEEEVEDDYGNSDDDWFGYKPTKEEKAEEAKSDYEDCLSTNRIMLVDAEGFPQLVQSFREGFRLDRKNYLFRDNKTGKRANSGTSKATTPQEPPFDCYAFGVNLGVGAKWNELGWMAFEEGELVGFLYDGAYCDLGGSSFQYGDVEVEVPRKPESEYDELNVQNEEQTIYKSAGEQSQKVCPDCSSRNWECSDCGYRAHGAGDFGGLGDSDEDFFGGYGNWDSDSDDYGDFLGDFGCLGGYGGSAGNFGGYGDITRDFGGHASIARAFGGHASIARDFGGHASIATASHKSKKRKRGGSQLNHCDHCLRDGHTRERCFALHPELRPQLHCDHCQRHGHTQNRCFALYPGLRAQMRQRAGY